jgi:peptide chain release factor 2
LICSGGIFDLDARREKIAQFEKVMGAAGFWNDQEGAQRTIDAANTEKRWVEGWKSLDARLSDLDLLFEMARDEEDEDALGEVKHELEAYQKELDAFELRHMLGDREDRHDAILTIHPGAGGTEAADWAQMLMRMYMRWAERRGFETNALEVLPAETAGIKSATLEMKGEYAFGYLKSESGVHRLVRISPFDSNSRRHTSFASVYVYPDADGDIEVEIDAGDLRIDTYRAGGAGGQHVNKTDSAVRITHLPTGIVVQCQNERSQLKNRNTAMKILKARLYQHLKDIEDKKKAERASEKKSIEWGSQIRNYVFQPYQMVKDARTGHESSDVQGVMDGDIDTFIETFLRQAGRR